MSENQPIEEQLASLRERVSQLESDDADFARRSNLLLDEIIITDDNLKTLTRHVDTLTEKVDRLTGQMDTLTERMDTLTIRVDQLAVSLGNTQAIVTQLATLMVQFTQNAEADRVTIRENQAEVRRIWEYLLSQHPNGKGGGV